MKNLMKIMNHDQSNEQIRLSSNLGEKKIKCFILINCFLLAFVACAFDIRISRGAVIFSPKSKQIEHTST